MSSWSMNDGSALSGTYTLTNASAIVQGNSSADTSEIKVGDIVIDDNGDKVRVADIQPARTVATSAVNASNDQITITNHGFVANQEVHYKANGGTAIAGLTDETTFFVKTVASANAFTLSATEGGALIDITGTGNNAQTISGTSTKAFTASEAFAESTNSGSSCTVTRPPANFASAAPHIDGNIFGYTPAEKSAGSDNVVSVGIANQGTGYASAPSVSFSGGGGSSAAATAVLTDNKVTSFTVTNVGSSYTSAPTVAVAAPAEVTFNAQSAVSTANDTITMSSHPFETGDSVTYSDKTGTTLANLTDGGEHFIIKVDANTVKLATTASNAVAGTAIDLTAGSSENHGLTGVTATATASLGTGADTGVHAGWVKRTIGTGGRAGRVHLETLVAASSISGDAEDIVTPDS